MPDPNSLKVGDLIRFVAIPEEWSHPDHTIRAESIAFMKAMLKRASPSRVASVGEDGTPWIHARLSVRGKFYYHCWAIMESTGWRQVRRRRQEID